MTEVMAITGIQGGNAQTAQNSGTEPVSREIVNLFEHLLGQKIQEPGGPAADALARILANPSSLGDHILANVEGMHQTFNEFSTELESRLVPPGAEGMSLSGSVAKSDSAGGVYSNLDFTTEASPGPASQMPAAADGKGNVIPGYEGWQNEMRELLWVQYNVGRILVHEEMMSKAAGKSTQNLDMLLRGQ